MLEKWENIVGYEGFYQVSSQGRIKRVEHADRNGHVYKERLLNIKPDKRGYCRVHLSKEGVTKWWLVHRIVAEAFIEKPFGCDIVNHLDNNPSNNNVLNLEWTTYKGNMQHAAAQGRMAYNKENLKKAQESKKIPVVAIKNGKRYEFESGVEAERQLGVNSSHIAACCRQEYGYKKLKGYRFEYANPDIQKKQVPNKTKMSEKERKKILSERMKGNKNAKGVSPSAETRRKLSIACSKPIDQYDLNGVFIKSYSSATKAKQETGIWHADSCARGDRKTAGGYIWKYKKE